MPKIEVTRKAVDRIAETLRVERARRRLSQTEVAKLAGTTPARISEIENGNRDPHLSTIERIASVLGLSVDLIESAA